MMMRIMTNRFSSLVAWQMAKRFLHRRGAMANGETTSGFEIQGIILAGGFVHHPIPLEVRLGRLVNQWMPAWGLRAALAAFRTYARLRFHGCPEALASIDDFIQRRTELDHLAIRQRFRLIEQSDQRSIAREFDRLMRPVIGVERAASKAVHAFETRQRRHRQQADPQHGGALGEARAFVNIVALATHR